MLDKKTIDKSNQALIDNHKECCTTWLISWDCNVKLRKLFFRLYDQNITVDNIRNFYHVAIAEFCNALVTGKLNQIKQYVQE